MRREIAGYQRRLEKMSSDERGEIGESQILAALRAAFPRDKIERLNKTRGSADIHHEVREGSKSCGTIVYECKDVRQWQKAYVAQARASRALHQASHAVLVSTAFPRSARYLCFVRDVVVVHPAIVTSVAQCLRQSLVVLAGTRGSPAERERRADRLLQYAKGDDFRRHMTGIAEAVIDLRDLQAKERQAHLRVWEQQAGYLDQVDSGHAKIHARIEAILEGTNEASLPEAAAS